MAGTYQAIRVKLRTTDVVVYASPRVAKALDDLTANMPLYEGVKVEQILEAMYRQGAKDGARTAFDELDRRVADAKKLVPHKNPGHPKGRRATATRRTRTRTA
jgi:hypothetical protein